MLLAYLKRGALGIVFWRRKCLNVFLQQITKPPFKLHGRNWEGVLLFSMFPSDYVWAGSALVHSHPIPDLGNPDASLSRMNLSMF